MNPRPDAHPPVAVTDEALSRLAEIRARQQPRPDQALGLVLEAEGKMGLVLDVPDEGDRVFSHHGTPVLFIAHDAERRLRGHLIDFEGAPGASRFTIARVPTAGVAS